MAVVVSALTGGALPLPPRALPAPGAGRGDLFRYVPAQDADFVARATAGNAEPLFTQSPGGAIATATRVAALRPLVDRATAGTGVSPDLLEALVFVESAGRAQVIAGNDPASAAGLTQILAATGQTLLGMHIDLARSRRLTGAIAAVARGHPARDAGPSARPARRRRRPLQPGAGAGRDGALPGHRLRPVSPLGSRV